MKTSLQVKRKARFINKIGEELQNIDKTFIRTNQGIIGNIHSETLLQENYVLLKQYINTRNTKAIYKAIHKYASFRVDFYAK